MASSRTEKPKKKLNLKEIKEKLTDDTLDLSLYSIEVVPVKEIAELTKARKLNLSYNLLVTLPDDFVKLQNIRELDLSKNKLQVLPKNFGGLVNLRNLDLLGNELTKLPTSFSELKSLQWLDLKGNPLEEPLRKAAGDCSNEAQCKKCAVNVINYMKQVAVEEERARQIELKKKREEQAKKEAEEREKAEQLRVQKKLEREQRRIVNEKKKQRMFDDGHEEESDKTNEANGHAKTNEKSTKKKKRSSSIRSVLSAVWYVLVSAVFVAFTYVLLSNYCEGGNGDLRANLRARQWLHSTLNLVDARVCPAVVASRPTVRAYIKPFELI